MPLNAYNQVRKNFFLPLNDPYSNLPAHFNVYIYIFIDRCINPTNLADVHESTSPT